MVVVGEEGVAERKAISSHLSATEGRSVEIREVSFSERAVLRVRRTGRVNTHSHEVLKFSLMILFELLYSAMCSSVSRCFPFSSLRKNSNSSMR